MAEKEKDQLSLDLPVTAAPQEPSASAPETEPVALEWVCHPAKKRPRTAILVSLFIIVIVVIVYYWTYSPWFAIVSFMILTGSLSAFYFPMRYRLTADEIIIRGMIQTLHRKWSQYRTFYPDKNGVLLSPFVRPSRLENFRGVYIRFSGNKDDVMAFVKERMGKADRNKNEVS